MKLSSCILLCLFLAACGDNQTPFDNDSVTPDSWDTPEADTVEPLCVPNDDGRIDANELAPSLNVPASYAFSPASQEQSIDLKGESLDEQRRRWSWNWSTENDQKVSITASSTKGKWFEALFPADAFAVPMDRDGATLGVYLHSSEAFELLGIVSAEENPPQGKTQLIYQSPIVLYRFPMQSGDTWVSVGEVHDGTFNGLKPYAGRDTYVVKVDLVGEMILPQLTFSNVLRVQTQVTVQPAAGLSVSTRQVSYIAECYGEVARVTSRLGESNEDFEVAAEIRRFAF
ncbi:MAG: hypothetical protein RBU37_05600 [Myxococcota bacterium]|jgi:hypothetical protein|nr:hypothetical protein [Myxococcota bacterium]